MNTTNNNLQAELDAAVNMDDATWDDYIAYKNEQKNKQTEIASGKKGEHMGTTNTNTTTIVNTGETVKTNAKQVVSTTSNGNGLSSQWHFKKQDVELSVPFLPIGYDKDVQKYMREGKGSKWKDKKFEKILKMSQESLAEHCKSVLLNLGYQLTIGDGWIYARGTHPVMLVAHLDTVHDPKPTQFIYKDNFVTSPQGIGGDDRCGVRMILNIVKEIKCHVLFCFDEEVGCVGAGKFAKSKTCSGLKTEGEINYIIELDRKGTKDCVFYDCENSEFDKFIQSTKYFKKDWGTCSDISYIAPALGVAAVNLSSGYFHEHHKDEYIDLEAMSVIEEEVKNILKLECKEPFEYIEAVFNYGGYTRGYYNYWNDDYYNSSLETKGKVKSTTTSGYDNGYQVGYSDGYNDGYNTGYVDGREDLLDELGFNDEKKDSKEDDYRLECCRITSSRLVSKEYKPEDLKTFVVYFKGEDENLKVAEILAASSDEALGMFLQKYPKLRICDILGFGYED